MKNTFICLIAALLLASCGTRRGASEEDLQLIAKYVEAVENMDLEAMETYLDDSYLGIGPSYGDTIRKQEAVANWKSNVLKLYQKIEYKKSRNAFVIVDSGENKGNWVSNWAELEITFRDGGETVTIWANSVYQIRAGKIIKSYTFYNEADALEQLGYVFINPDDL